jgi:hypothetical protein
MNLDFETLCELRAYLERSTYEGRKEYYEGRKEYLIHRLNHWIVQAERELRPQPEPERKPEPKPASSECQCKMMQPTHRTSPGTLYEVVCDTCGLGVSPAVGLRICDTCGGIITNTVWERWSKVEEFYFGAWHWKELISVLFPKGESIYAFIGGNTFTVTRGGKVILCLTAKEMAEMPEIKP